MSREVTLWNRYCFEVYHSFCGELCIRECGVIYEGILMRSLLVSSLHSISSSRNRHYELILMRSIDLISGMASKTLFNLGKYSFGHHNKHVFLKSSNLANTFVLLCLKCYVDKEENLVFHISSNVYALYCLHLSCHLLSALSK